jgi:hypothetical protein
MDAGTLLMLAGAGVLAGLANALAGGGTFFTFPALLAAGLPPVTANATSALAVWPGHAAAVLPARAELLAERDGLPLRCAVAAGGGLAGGALLLLTGDRAFAALVPWLLLLATAAFAAAPWLRARLARAPALRPRTRLLAEFLVCAYGGYFGAGLGIMLMASLTLAGTADPRRANALKNLLGSLATSVAVLVFVVAGAVAWPYALPALAGAIAGGVAGGRLAGRLPAPLLRATVIAVGAALTAVFFWRTYA